MLHPKLLDQIIDVAAKAAYKSSLLKGKGDKNAADQAAVDAMRTELNKMNIYGKVVIGEGEMDEAPMLYIGEILGKTKEPKIDIAVDPLDGTKLAANNQPNAISVISISEEGQLLQAPDTYMDKISVGPNLPENIVDLDEDIKKNIENLAKAKNKNVKDTSIHEKYEIFPHCFLFSKTTHPLPWFRQICQRFCRSHSQLIELCPMYSHLHR